MLISLSFKINVCWNEKKESEALKSQQQLEHEVLKNRRYEIGKKRLKKRATDLKPKKKPSFAKRV